MGENNSPSLILEDDVEEVFEIEEVMPGVADEVRATPQLEWEDTLTAVRKTRLTKPKTLAICGFAHDSRDWAPYDKRTVEIWGCNETYAADYMKTSEGKFRADRWFQMHLEEDWSRNNNPNDPRHPEWIRAKHNFPLVMQEKFGPGIEAFPLEETDKIFFSNAYAIDYDKKKRSWLDVYKHGYYTSTFSWMMAYALWQKVTGQVDWEVIEVYGFNAASQSEYMYQKPCAEFWLSQALARNVDVRIAGTSPLMRGSLYGYQVADVLLPTHLDNRIKSLEKEIPNLEQEAFQHHGAKLMVQALRNHKPYSEKLPELFEVYDVRQQEELEATSKVNFYKAAKKDSETLKKALFDRHDNDQASGWIDRMSLEIQKVKIRESVEETEEYMHTLTGALAECRRMKSIYARDDLELEGSFRQREIRILNKLIETTNKLNSLMGSLSNVSWLILEAENRTPNLEDEYDFGYVVIPQLFSEDVDVLQYGEKEHGKKETEKVEKEIKGGAGGSSGEPGESS